ncbi:GNAT family N-acetyltransferase [Parabacteroides faecis]|uniref:N-acetyltransferase n=1 Tax=Parabacteroides faecis TaxID=1217282 RepID=A0ABR6KMR8_9BACT|nr:GNAT family N-acetyltransferase [Parabacteroides faecis]MBB4622684.1 hypothetical protein [Parabacteroides faecis]GGK08761.1 N-acetyltransferase [Parabacteroides faecis]
MNKGNFLENSCTFSLLKPELLKECKPFICGNDDLDDFFMNNSDLYTKQLLGKTYCFRLDEDLSVITCAFTVANDSIKANFLPNSRKKKVIQDIPFSKQRRSYPAVLIGRLGVNMNYQGCHIGNELIGFIKDWFISPENKTGCRFIVVDAYNKSSIISFYEKNNFYPLFSTEQQEKEYLGIPESSSLFTRLMIFDLINIT